MRILNIIGSLEIGGAELVLARLVVGLKEHARVADVLVVTFGQESAVSRQLERNGVKVYCADLRGVTSFLPRFVAMIGRMREFSPDIVQTWMYPADFIGGLLARLLGFKRVFWNIRNTDVNQGISYTTRLAFQCCRLFATFIPYKIIVVTEVSKSWHQKRGYPGKKMMVIENGFSAQSRFGGPSDRTAARVKLLGPGMASKLLVGSAARFNFYKDHPNLLSGFAHYIGRHPDSPMVLVLVGYGVTPMNAVLMRLLTDLGIRERVLLLGHQDDMSLFYQSIDVFCMHSRSEGLPNVLMEAVFHELPVVTTDVGGAADICGSFGCVVTPQDPKALALGFETLLSTRDAWPHNVKRAKQRLLERYGMDYMITEYLQAYDSGRIRA